MEHMDGLRERERERLINLLLFNNNNNDYSVDYGTGGRRRNKD